MTILRCYSAFYSNETLVDQYEANNEYGIPSFSVNSAPLGSKLFFVHVQWDRPFMWKSWTWRTGRGFEWNAKYAETEPVFSAATRAQSNRDATARDSLGAVHPDETSYSCLFFKVFAVEKILAPNAKTVARGCVAVALR